ncbi:metallophosphoesterase family protein [Burkholderia gladioli]|uniref:metallophosphoesterase family protein n=1 Tax=Burkholderia gladioli TaxID=28095 RepID=UPI0015E7B363|nr:metallophosphoesterase [Burkholderia gladioli]MBA1361479.1 metallophosphoesterase [Burkholderia gladioli]
MSGQDEQKISWLHISDLHAGQKSHEWLWPSLRTQLYDDFARLNERMRGWDLIIFSGDLTQSGSKEDFGILSDILAGMWEHFGTLGLRPKIFVTPGNHDLVRPGKGDPIVAALKSYWSNDDVRNEFWNSENTAYKNFVDNVFSNYMDFIGAIERGGIPVCAGVRGLLPGDSSAIVEHDGLKLGLVGLNSTFLHLFDVGEGSLDINVRQLHSVTSGDPDAWCTANDFNFLVTHHPVSWLEARAKEHFYQEIHTRNRFTAHMFGHMHVPEIHSRTSGGSDKRNAVQAASLCGLEHCAGGKLNRTHGYSGGSLTCGETTQSITFWPRIDTKVTAGGRRFIPDATQDLTEDNNFTWELGTRRGVAKPPTGLVRSVSTVLADVDEEAATSEGGASALVYRLEPAPSHSAVRRLEQNRLKLALEQRRTAWLVSDWGYATDEFIWSVLSTMAPDLPTTYRISLADYKGRDDFFARFTLQTGKSFPEFCKSISGSARVLLLIEDTPVSRGTVPQSAEYEAEVLLIVDAIREYCASSSIILVSRQAPQSGSSDLPAIIEIKPFDEADVKTYVINNPLGGQDKAGAYEITDIYRLSGGVPIEIDSILKDLEFISLSDLVELRLTSHDSRSPVSHVSSGVDRVIEQLCQSTDPELKKSFELLKVMTMFPYGETLMRVRRIDFRHTFYLSHVTVLADRGLIESVAVQQILDARSANASQSPKLVTKKAVRDYVLSILSADEKEELNIKAASLYFGDKWIIGEPRKLKASDLAKSLGVDGGLGNPHAVINSLLSHHCEFGEFDKLDNCLKITRIFLTELKDRGNYRNCLTACQDFLRLLPGDQQRYVDDRNWINLTQGICLRMLGDHEKACSIFESLEDVGFTKRMKQDLYLSWALAVQNSNAELSKSLSEKVISLGKGTFQALQAKSTILEVSEEDPEQLSKLASLEKRARGKKAFVTANNISYFMAHKSNPSDVDKKRRMKEIANSAIKNGNEYSAARAVVAMGTASRNALVQLKNDELSASIGAYHYLFKERMDAIFANCHRNLWFEFKSRNQHDDMLKLFRHSSFIWRLHGDEHREKEYINELATLISNDRSAALLEGAELGYFITRMERLRIK